MRRRHLARRAGHLSPRRARDASRARPEPWEPSVEPLGAHARPLGGRTAAGGRSGSAAGLARLAQLRAPPERLGRKAPVFANPDTQRFGGSRPGPPPVSHTEGSEGGEGPREGTPPYRGVTIGLTSLRLSIPPHQFLIFFFSPLTLCHAQRLGGWEWECV